MGRSSGPCGPVYDNAVFPERGAQAYSALIRACYVAGEVACHTSPLTRRNLTNRQYSIGTAGSSGSVTDVRKFDSRGTYATSL